MINKIFFFVFSLTLLSCNTSDNNTLQLADSIDILKSSIDSRLFSDEIRQYADTLFIIRNKNYHAGYPNSTKYFKLIYLEDSLHNKTLTKPNLLIDKRERLEVTDFSLKADTVLISIYNHGFGEGYKFKYVKKNNDWLNVSARVILN